MKITKRQLKRLILEAMASTPKYDDDSALQGDQDELPDDLQKGIIDKAIEDREEAKDKKSNEVRLLIRSILRETMSGPSKLHKWAQSVGLQVDIDPMTGDEVVLISDTFAMKNGLPDGTDWGVERSIDDDGWIVTASPDYGMIDFEMPSGDLSDLDDIGIDQRGY